MIQFRPHTLRVVSTTEGHTEDNGDWVEGQEVLSDPVPCRYEQNGKAKTIILEDGKAYVYSFTVYLDLSDTQYAYGTIIQLFDNNGTKAFEKKIVGFRRGQLNMKLWI